MQPAAAFEYYVRNGTAVLLRCWGEDPCAALPAQLGGYPLAAVAGYAFSEKSPAVPAGVQLCRQGSREGLASLSGNFLQQLALPDGVLQLGPCAFYNCRKLERLQLPQSLARIECDAFMNCHALETLILHAAPSQPSPLRQAAALIDHTFCAVFRTGQATSAQVLFPEYYEEMEENAPAHLFSRAVVGIGYRYRKCFAGELLNFAEYDNVFSAAAEEPHARLARLALYRLRYPHALTDTAAQNYTAWLAAHDTTALCYAAGLEDESLLAFALELGFARPAAAAEAAAVARKLQKPRTAALLLQAARPAAIATSYDF